MILARLRRLRYGLLGAALAWTACCIGPDLAIALLGLRADRALTANLTVADALRYVPPAAPYAAAAAALAWIIFWFRGRGGARLLRRQRDMQTIRGLSWQDFEQLCREVFTHEGWRVRTRGTSRREAAGPDEDDAFTHRGLGDGGVDLVLSDGRETHLVQCKHWRVERVGVREVRELFGVVALEGAASGVFVSSGDYTREAVRFAQRAGLRLIDGDELLAQVLAIRGRHFARRSARQARSSTLLDPDQDAPKRAGADRAVPDCPACGIPMLERTHVRGNMAGKRFWGCPTYPHCRGTRKMPRAA